MRLSFFRGLVGLAGAMLLASAQAAPEVVVPLRVCLPDLEAIPYLNAPDQPPGLIERLLMEAGQQSGLPVRITRAPILRCRLMMDNGEIDASLAGWNAANQERARFPMKGETVDPARRIVRVAVTWVQRRNAALTWDGQHFSSAGGQPITVGTLRSVAMVANGLQLQGYRLENTSTSIHQLLLQLRAGRVEAAVGLVDQVQREFDKGGFDDLEIVPGTSNQHDFYVVVRRERYASSSRLIETFWDRLGKLREMPGFQAR